MLEHPNVPQKTDQITPTPKTPNLSDDCPMSADPTTDNNSISSNIGEEWSNSISLNKMLPFAPGPILLNTRNPTEKSKIIDPHIIRKMHPARMMLKDQLQSNTGANCGATNDISILWYYKILSRPIPITTYSDESTNEPSCVAIGTGIRNSIANDSTITNWTMLHTPGSTGTILLPDRYVMHYAKKQMKVLMNNNCEL
jgi:hypothetical protein